MGKINDGWKESTRGQMAVGAKRTVNAKDTTGVVFRVTEITRTARAYAFDVCDSYNKIVGLDKGPWFVDATGYMRIEAEPTKRPHYYLDAQGAVQVRAK